MTASPTAQLFCPIDIAHATVDSLGQLERIQFKDLNPEVNPFQRTYVSQIRRCDEAERRLRFLTQQIAAQEIHIRPYEETSALIANMSGPQALEELDSRLSESEQRVVAMNTSYDNLEKRALELEEARQVLRETERFFLEAQGRSRDIRSSFEQEEGEALLGSVEAAGLSAGEGGLGGGGGFELESVKSLASAAQRSCPSCSQPTCSSDPGSWPVRSTARGWPRSSASCGASSAVTCT